jgi:hypothetical protein
LLHLCPLGIIASPVECRCAREDKISGDFDPREYDPRHVMAAMAHRTANVVVRSMRADEARRFLEIHRAAVRGLAVKDYPLFVIDQWAPLPITDAMVEQFLTNPDDEIRLIAELDGVTVGIGALVRRGQPAEWTNAGVRSPTGLRCSVSMRSRAFQMIVGG